MTSAWVRNRLLSLVTLEKTVRLKKKHSSKIGRCVTTEGKKVILVF